MTHYDLKTLRSNFPHQGSLVWIGLRPAKNQPMLEATSVNAGTEYGLQGDYYSAKSNKRQVTLFQFEDLTTIESFLGRPVSPALFRRNLLIKGINLMSLKAQTFMLGDALFKVTGICHPCSKMETALGMGGYNAMRSHCGMTAQVIRSGMIQIGDSLTPETFQDDLFC